MKRTVLILAVLGLLIAPLTLEARGFRGCRGGACSGGSCAVPVVTADLPKGWDPALHPRDPESGRFVKREEEPVVQASGDCGRRQPLRAVGRRAGRVLLAPFRFVARRGCRGC